MARPLPPAASASISDIFQRAIGLGKDSEVYDCDGVQFTAVGEGRPTILSVPDESASAEGRRSYSVLGHSVRPLDEFLMDTGEQLTPDDVERLRSTVLSRIESTKSEIKKGFSSDGAETISDDDVNFFLRSEILAKHKDKMIPFIKDAVRDNPGLTFREAVTQLRSISDEQLYAILNLEFDYERVTREAPHHLTVQYLEEVRKKNPAINLVTVCEEFVALEPHKFLATYLGFSPEIVEMIEADKSLHLNYLVDLKLKLSSEGKPLKTAEEMLAIIEQTEALTHKNQFRGLLLGLNPEVASRLEGEALDDNFHLQYLTNFVVGNRRISELPDEEKAARVGEIFASIEGCENFPQCVAKKELGFPDDVVHSMIEDGDGHRELIREYDLENVNFITGLKAKKPSLTIDDLVAAYRQIIYFDDLQFEAANLGLPLEIAETVRPENIKELTHLKKLKIKNSLLGEGELGAIYQKLSTFSELQFEAMDLGLPLKIAERYFGDAAPHAHLQLSYLKNFKAKNPETTDEGIAAKFVEIQPLTDELQLRALKIGLSPAQAKKFIDHNVYEKRIIFLENLKLSRPEALYEESIDIMNGAVADSTKLSYELFGYALDLGISFRNAGAILLEPNIARFELLQKLIKESPSDYPDAEAINTKFSELLDAPAPDAAGAGAAAMADDGRSPPAL